MYNKIALHITLRDSMFINPMALILQSGHLTFIRAEQLNVGLIALMKQDTAWSTFSYGTILEDLFARVCKFLTVVPSFNGPLHSV